MHGSPHITAAIVAEQRGKAITEYNNLVSRLVLSRQARRPGEQKHIWALKQAFEASHSLDTFPESHWLRKCYGVTDLEVLAAIVKAPKFPKRTPREPGWMFGRALAW
jgi:hypothetical protein